MASGWSLGGVVASGSDAFDLERGDVVAGPPLDVGGDQAGGLDGEQQFRVSGVSASHLVGVENVDGVHDASSSA
jgi:hypothetical protein